MFQATEGELASSKRKFVLNCSLDFFFVYCVCVCTHTPWCKREDQRRTLSSQFLLPTFPWGPGIELQLSNFSWQAPSPDTPSPQPLSHTFRTKPFCY